MSAIRSGVRIVLVWSAQDKPGCGTLEVKAEGYTKFTRASLNIEEGLAFEKTGDALN